MEIRVSMKELLSVMLVELMSECFKYLLGTYQVKLDSVNLHKLVLNVQDMEMIMDVTNHGVLKRYQMVV